MICYTFILLLQALELGRAATLTLEVYYPESGISLIPGDPNVFSFGFSTSPYSADTPESLPWWGDVSYLISMDDKIDTNIWRKSIDLGDFRGDVFVNLASYPAFLFMSPEGRYTVNVCNNLIPLHDWTGGLAPCMPRHSPYNALFETASDTTILRIFPAFDALAQGNSTILVQDIYSPFFENHRAISAYIPPSFIENPMSRPLNILVLLDGFLDTVEYLANNGGFDYSVNTGIYSETLILGVPPGENGTACLHGGYGGDAIACAGIQRQYEYSYNECNPNITNGACCNSASNGNCPDMYGGGSQFLQFVWDSVIPAALAGLGAELGEVSIVGWSLGGSMSCYAASARPADFKRAYCMSPAMYTNNGDLIPMITENAKLLNAVPTSVVISVGTGEDVYIYWSPESGIPAKLWSDYIREMTDAFEAVGLGKLPPPEDLQTGVQPMQDSNLFFFKHNGGMHSMFSWSVAFQYGIALLSKFRFIDSTRSQRNENFVYVYPTVSTCTSTTTSSDDGANFSSPGFISIIFFLALFATTTVVLSIYVWRLTSRSKSERLMHKGSEFSSTL